MFLMEKTGFEGGEQSIVSFLMFISETYENSFSLKIKLKCAVILQNFLL